MDWLQLTTLILALAAIGLTGIVQHDGEVIRFHDPGDVRAESLHNIHVEFLDETFEGNLRLVYGDCGIRNPTEGHHDIGNVLVKLGAHPERFVWVTPLHAPHLHCLHAFSDSTLIGRSSPITVSSPIDKRESIADIADMQGPWFDGIAYMKSKKQDAAVVSKAKNSSVGIIGGDISGLLTSLLLESVGMHNWHIIESSERIGGRIRTKYLNKTRPDQYQYQEMGPMRFPASITYADTNETIEIMDQRMVFQLVGVLNKMNAGKPDLHVSFIPWIPSSPNAPADSGGVRLPDGQVPTAAEVLADSSLAYSAVSPNEMASADAIAAYENYTTKNNRNTTRKFAANMYKMHRWAVDNGMLYWSEAGYLRYALGYDANVSDYVAGTTGYPIWVDLYQSVYGAATESWTIDKGLESLPRAFLPHVAGRLTLNRTVEGLIYNETSGRIAVGWRKHPLQMTPTTQEYDYAVVSAPFSKVRLWSLPRYSSLLSRAISYLHYDPSCKMALMYKTRFWEHLEKPIFGGCETVDVPGVGEVCYPPYKINGTGPGAILASYVWGIPSRSTAALSVEDHVALIQRTMVEVHGGTAAEQFTGIFERLCWELDRHQAGASANPLVGQQELYLPAYYQTEFKTIFIGEHTSYTNGWAFSALDCAVRGTAQLLLDLGLVDEAKTIVEEWMGR